MLMEASQNNPYMAVERTEHCKRGGLKTNTYVPVQTAGIRENLRLEGISDCALISISCSQQDMEFVSDQWKFCPVKFWNFSH